MADFQDQIGEHGEQSLAFSRHRTCTPRTVLALYILASVLHRVTPDLRTQNPDRLQSKSLGPYEFR